MKIKYNEINKDILERKEKIAVLQEQANSLLEISEKGTATVNPANKERGAQLGKAIAELRRKNEQDSALLARVTDISIRYNIPLDELHQLNLSVPHFEKQIDELTRLIDHHRAIDPEQYEKEKNSKNSPLYQELEMLKHARESLKNHIAARKELSVIGAKQ